MHGGWAPKILLNTVADHPSQASGAVPPFFDIILKVLEYGGVPPDRVVRLDSAAATTFDEAKAVADYLADHPVKKLLIVTEGPHTRRARWIFQRVLADRPVEIAMVSAPADEFDNENWWRSEEGFLFVVSEYFKLFYYGLRYGRLGYEIAAAALLAIFLCAWFLRRRKLIEEWSRVTATRDRFQRRLDDFALAHRFLTFARPETILTRSASEGRTIPSLASSG